MTRTQPGLSNTRGRLLPSAGSWSRPNWRPPSGCFSRLVPDSFEVHMTSPEGYDAYVRILFPFIGLPFIGPSTGSEMSGRRRSTSPGARWRSATVVPSIRWSKRRPSMSAPMPATTAFPHPWRRSSWPRCSLSSVGTRHRPLVGPPVGWLWRSQAIGVRWLSHRCPPRAQLLPSPRAADCLRRFSRGSRPTGGPTTMLGASPGTPTSTGPTWRDPRHA